MAACTWKFLKQPKISTTYGSVTVRDLELIREQDIRTAVRETCAEKHVAVAL